MSPSLGQLCCKHVYVMDFRWRHQQFLGLRAQRLGDGTTQVCLSPCFVRKDIDDRERRRSCAEGKPGGCLRLALDKRQCASKELCKNVFLSGLRFQMNDESGCDHE